ncbi:MAG TPA: YraN family protein [Phycisphaerae bacterium]|nr:YraN family protein [Phycisphaerae bacterium]
MRTAPGRKKVGFWEWVGRKVGVREAPLADRGEAAAARYLRKQGMRIVSRNRRQWRGEIDLIGIEGEFLVFVEVRTRTSEEYMRPEDSVRHWKKRALVRTVRGLARRYGMKGLRPRIDVVGVVWPAGAKAPAAVRWWKGAVRVGGW